MTEIDNLIAELTIKLPAGVKITKKTDGFHIEEINGKLKKVRCYKLENDEIWIYSIIELSESRGSWIMHKISDLKMNLTIDEIIEQHK